jgi:ribosomal protein L7/L12
MVTQTFLVAMSVSLSVLCLILLVSLLGGRLSTMELRIGKLARVDAKLDLLLKHFDLKYDPYENLPTAVVEALRSGKTILAIKYYREATAVSLKEAKDFIEETQRRGGFG